MPNPRVLNRRQQRAQRIFRFAAGLAARYRRKRARQILHLLQPRGVRLLLDVGAGWGGFWTGLQDRMGSLKVIGLDVRRPDRLTPGRFVVADALHLPFRDRSADCVVCNSVLEHVGAFPAQLELAREIRRVARRLYLVQVPAMDFPIEPHLMLPFVQYLPQHVRRSLHRFLYGFDPGDIHLLRRRAVQELFPDAAIDEERICFLTKSFTARGEPEPDDASISRPAPRTERPGADGRRIVPGGTRR
ncbi:MAG: class I SAM-dependent methyltransferase [bacterium]